MSFETQWEAVCAAAAELEEGGTVWIHRDDCEDPEDSSDCPCGPMPLEIPPRN